MTKRRKFLGLLLILVVLTSFSIACSSDEPGTVKKAEGETAIEATQEEEKQQRQDLSVGDTYEIRDLAVTVTAIEDGGKNYDDKKLLKVSVSYVNNSTDSASFGSSDWAMQDQEGARSDTEYTDKDDLGYGELAPGGKKSGDVFFLAKGATKVIYTNNMFDGEDSLAMWNVK